MSNIFDERGLIVQGIDDVRTAMAEEAKIKLAKYLDGKELRTDDASLLGMLFAMTSKPAIQNAEILPLILASLDINQAEKEQLDHLLWNIHRIKRPEPSQAVGLVTLDGKIGTLVGKGSQVQNAITGELYQTLKDVTFSNTDTNGVDISFTGDSGVFEMRYTIDGYLSTSPTIQISVSGETTKNIAQRFVDVVNSQSSYLTANINNDNSVNVFITERSLVGNFSVSGNMTIVNAYTPVYAESITYDSSESSVGQITIKKSPVDGWNGVTNHYYIDESTPLANDEDYRYLGKLGSQTAVGQYNAILYALKAVKGVKYTSVMQNTSQRESNAGVVNNGLAISVQGGDEDEIAVAIFNTVSAGIMTVGDIKKQVLDINARSHEVSFSRPSSRSLEISMQITTRSNFPANGYNLIKQALVEWFNELEVGEDVYLSRLYQPINSVNGFGVRNLKIGLKGGTLTTDDIIIPYNEIATISAEDISIGGA